MPAAHTHLDRTAALLRTTLDYREVWCGGATLPDGTAIPFLAHSGLPRDSRTACIAVVEHAGADSACIAALRPCGAPVVISLDSAGGAQIWRQTTRRPVHLKEIPAGGLLPWLQENRKLLQPSALYRAKIWGHLEKPSAEQLEFVDLGLVQQVEGSAGEALSQLITDLIRDMRQRLQWTAPNGERSEWLLKAPFWLVAAKILQDKAVPGFIQLDLEDINTVFTRLSKHYNSADPRPIQTVMTRRTALQGAAATVKRFANLGTVSTEALGHVFENTLVTRETRKAYGTHRTPSWLIDYMLGRLRPWIAQQSANDRRICEPACGHAGFLLGGLRLLDELRPWNHAEPRDKYLRHRLRGIELDAFAYEIARLTLTLGDVPNPNGWKIRSGDMFSEDRLQKGIRYATIVLANPPYGPFERDVSPGFLPRKEEEVLRQVVQHLPEGGCFGLVLSQGVLWSRQLTDTRAKLLREFEIEEITVFADTVFKIADQESVILLGRRKAPRPAHTIRYQRVSEAQVATFEQDFIPTSEGKKTQQGFLAEEDHSLFVPDLEEVWEFLAAQNLPTLGECCLVGQGFQHKSREDKTFPVGAVLQSDTRRDGFDKGLVNWPDGQMTHRLPPTTWLNLDRSVIRRPHHGLEKGISQVLANYGRGGRGAWCFRALLDVKGNPVMSRFVVVRPDIGKSSLSLRSCWALFNSPLISAFVATISSKRDVLVGDLRDIRLPRDTDWSRVEAAARAYLEAAPRFCAARTAAAEAEEQPLLAAADGNPAPTPEELAVMEEQLRWLHWRMDAEVLRLYQLPEELEGRLLRYFTTTANKDARRKGVPFSQKEYFPIHFTLLNRLDDLLAITADWEIHSLRKTELIERKIARTATKAELAELARLKQLTEARGELLSPLPMPDMNRLRAELDAAETWSTI